MKITTTCTKVQRLYSCRKNQNGNIDRSFTTALPSFVSPNFSYCNTPAIETVHIPKTINFLGNKVHILDGGNHATNMEHFAKALDKNLETTMHNVETNKKDKNTKQLKSLEQQLKLMNQKDSYRGEYVAIPVLASVALLNIQDQYNVITGENKKFTPENVKANKENLLKFLETIYKNPQKYRRYICYLDPINQGIEHTWGVIQEINKLIEKDARVYVPSGHPQDTTLKWMAKDRGLSEELYYFIATHKDPDKKITRLHQEIKDNNWYDFNLLSLSDANIVGVKDTKQDSWTSRASDYLFSAYDSCITDGARGVYNFTPVRKGGNIIGYSYTDSFSNQYPYEEFPANEEVANIAKFTGLQIQEVLANEDEIEELRKKKKAHLDTSDCADKLYPVEELYTRREIIDNKMELQGDYTDKSLKLFFSINDRKKVIFPKCDCEGSGRPSVLSMWGSCFSVFSAIARDINLDNKYKNSNNSLQQHRSKIDKFLKKANENSYYDAQMYLLDAIKQDKIYKMNNPYYKRDFRLYYELGNMHMKHDNLEAAQSCYNNTLDCLAKAYFRCLKGEYLPYDPYDIYSRYMPGLPEMASVIYEKLAFICEQKGEKYPARVCLQAAKDLKSQNNQRGIEVMKLRAKGVQYIGDLYSEIKPD